MTIPKERCVVVKAVLGDEIVGWAAWAFRGFGDGEIVLDFEDGAQKSKNESVGSSQDGSGKEEVEEDVYVPPTQEMMEEHEKELSTLLSPTDEEIMPVERLNSTTNLSMEFWNAHLSYAPASSLSSLSSPSDAQAAATPKPNKHVCLIAFTISSQYQGHGVGRKLMGWGTGIADEKGVYAWVSSSDGGVGFFEKMGFEEKGRLELDLDKKDYCGGVGNPEGAEGKWGIYAWRYMRREAR